MNHLIMTQMKQNDFHTQVQMMREAQKQWRAHHGKRDEVRMRLLEGVVDAMLEQHFREVTKKVAQGELFGSADE